jgi:hypothetical protein
MGSEFTPDARQEQHEAPWHQCAPSLRDLVSRYGTAGLSKVRNLKLLKKVEEEEGNV